MREDSSAVGDDGVAVSVEVEQVMRILVEVVVRLVEHDPVRQSCLSTQDVERRQKTLRYAASSRHGPGGTDRRSRCGRDSEERAAARAVSAGSSRPSTVTPGSPSNEL